MSYLHSDCETSTTNIPIDWVSVLHSVIWEIWTHKGQMDVWGQEEGGNIEAHTLHKGCQGTGGVDGLFCLSCWSTTPFTGDSNVFPCFFKSRNIPELNPIQIIDPCSKTTVKFSCTTCCKSVTRADCRTQEKLLVGFLNFISLVWNIKRSVNYVY